MVLISLYNYNLLTTAGSSIIIYYIANVAPTCVGANSISTDLLAAICGTALIDILNKYGKGYDIYVIKSSNY